MISNRTPFVGDAIEMTFFFDGGTAPYTYEISFENAPEDAPWRQRAGRTNESGWAVEKFQLTDAQAGSKLAYTIRVMDTGGATGSYTSDEKCCIDVREKQEKETDTKTGGGGVGL